MQKLDSDVISKLQSGLRITDATQCVLGLVENSLDAKATAIVVRVNLRDYRIEVADNGTGISYDALKLVGQRFMTSKCHKVSDLNKNLSTYGFQGQTIASLPNLCTKLCIQTKTKNHRALLKMFKNGKALPIQICKYNITTVGTTVTIHDFMSTMPVRRKRILEVFDLADITRQLEYLAIIHNEVFFTLRDEKKGQILLQTHKNWNNRLLVSNVFELSANKFFVPINYDKGEYKVNGFIGLKRYSENNLQLLYVNRRIMFCSAIHHFINFLVNKYLDNCFEDDKELEMVHNMHLNTQETLHNVFIVLIQCPYSLFEVFRNKRKPTVEFRDWDKVFKIMQKTIDAAFRDLLKESKSTSCQRFKKNKYLKPLMLRNELNVGECTYGLRGAPAKRRAFAKEVPDKKNNALPITMKKDKRKAFKTESKCTELQWNILKKTHSSTKNILPESPIPSANTLLTLKKLNSLCLSSFNLKNSVCTMCNASNLLDFAVRFQPKYNNELNVFQLHKNFIENKIRSIQTSSVIKDYKSPTQKAAPSFYCENKSKKEILKHSNLQRKIFLKRSSIKLFDRSTVNVITPFENEKRFVDKSFSQEELDGFSRMHESIFSNLLIQEKVETKANNLVKNSVDTSLGESSRRFSEIMRLTSEVSADSGDESLTNSKNVLMGDWFSKNHTKYNSGSSYAMGKMHSTTQKTSFNAHVIKAVPRNERNENKAKVKNHQGKKVHHQYNVDHVFVNSSDRDQPHSDGKPNKKYTNIDMKTTSVNNKSSKRTLADRLPISVEENSVLKRVKSRNFLFRDPEYDCAKHLQTPINSDDQANCGKPLLLRTDNNFFHESFGRNRIDAVNVNSNRSKFSQNHDRELWMSKKSISNKNSSCNYKFRIRRLNFTSDDSIQTGETCAINFSYDESLTSKLMGNTVENLRNCELKTIRKHVDLKKNSKKYLAKNFDNFLSTDYEKSCTPTRFFSCTDRYSFIPKGLSQTILQENLVKSIKENEVNNHSVEESSDSVGRNVFALKSKLPDGMFEELQNKTVKNLVHYENKLLETGLNKQESRINNLQHSLTIQREALSKIKVIGQWDCKFIIATADFSSFSKITVLLAFDQHAVDERIQVEKLLKEYRGVNGKFLSSGCDPPIRCVLSESIVRVVPSLKDKLDYYGIKVSIFDSQTVLFHRVPLCLNDKENYKIDGEKVVMLLKNLTIHLVQEFSETRGAISSIPNTIYDEISSMACQKAVKFNQNLPINDMNEMIAHWRECQFPYQCAHGRPCLTPIIELSKLSNQKEEKPKLNFKKFWKN